MGLERKYVVFKAEEWDDWRWQIDDPSVPLPSVIEDSVVIRHQDIFAPGVFYSYATQLRSAVEIMANTAMNHGYDPETGVLGKEIARLTALADAFMDEAAKAEQFANRKVPD